MPTDQFGDPIPAGAIGRLGTSRYGGPGDRPTALTFSSDGKTLASVGEDFAIRLWNLATSKELRRFGEHQAKVSALAFSGDGKMLASGSADGLIRFWDVASGRELRRLTGHSGAVLALAIAGDGKTLASAATDQTVRFWEVLSGREVRQARGDFSQANAIAFAPDGKSVAIGGWENTIRLCDVASGTELRQFAGHRSYVQSLAFAPDGRTLVSGSADESIRLWEIVTGKERMQFPGQKDGTFCLSYAPDGKSLASAGTDTTVLIWDITLRSLETNKRPVPLMPKQIEAMWPDVASDDAVKAFRAIWALNGAGAPGVALIKTRLPLLLPNPQRVANFVTDLNSEQFAKREKATVELEKLGGLCEPAMRAALLKQPPAETRRRLEKLIAKLQEPPPSPDTLHALRAVEVLEITGTPDAVAVLQGMARQTPPTVVALDAKVALERLTRRGPAKP